MNLPIGVLIAMVLLVGMLQPLQAGMNAEFARHSGHALRGAALNMWVGAVAIGLVLLAARVRPPGPAALQSAPTWSLAGGLIGASLVTTMLMAAPRLGAGLLVATFLLGQLGASALIDHFGLAGYAQRAVTPGRLLGLGLVLAGVLVVERTR